MDSPKIKLEKINKSDRALRKYKIYIDSFSTIIGEEFIDLLGARDYIEKVLPKADKSTKIEVKKLDEKLINKKSEILQKFSGLAEWPEYPKSFWWRHLKDKKQI